MTSREYLRKLRNHSAGLQGYRKDDESSSSSSSSTSTATYTSSNTQNTDKRQVVSDFGLGVSSDSSNVTVNQSDFGAIAGAFDLSKYALASAGNAARDAAALSASAGNAARDAAALSAGSFSESAGLSRYAVGQAVDLSKTALEGANNNFERVMLAAGDVFDRLLDGASKNQEITQDVLRSYSPIDGNRAATKDKLDAATKIAIALGASFVVAKFVR